MKKKTLIILLVTLVFYCMCLVGCGKTQEKGISDDGKITLEEEDTEKEVEILNSNSNLGCKTLMYNQNVSGDFNSQAPLQFTIEGLSGTDVEGYFFPYPYNDNSGYKAKDCRLTQLYVYSDAYQIFGIKIGDKIEDADIIMTDKGYTRSSWNSEYYENNNLVVKTYVIGELHVQFTLSNDEGSIDEIFIGVFRED